MEGIRPSKPRARGSIPFGRAPENNVQRTLLACGARISGVWTVAAPGLVAQARALGEAAARGDLTLGQAQWRARRLAGGRS